MRGWDRTKVNNSKTSQLWEKSWGFIVGIRKYPKNCFRMSERKPGRDRVWKRRFQHGWERARQQYVPSTIISKFELFWFNHLQMWTREAWMAMIWRDLATPSIGEATERMPTRWSISSEDILKILLKAHSRWMTLFVERKGKSRSVTWGEIVLALLQQFVTTININHHHHYQPSPSTTTTTTTTTNHHV